MSDKTKNLAIQVLLLAAWGLIIIVTQMPVEVNSQTACEQPPYLSTPPLASWPNYAWPQTKLIAVKIDDAFGGDGRGTCFSNVSLKAL